MTRSALYLIAVALTAALSLSRTMGAQNPVFRSLRSTRRAKVSLLALSSSVHQGFAGNQDVYLAEVRFKNDPETFARLVDIYSGDADPIRRSILTERRSLNMLLVRSPECDAPRREILLATPERNVFDATARQSMAESPDEVVPCFRVDRTLTRLQKK